MKNLIFILIFAFAVLLISVSSFQAQTNICGTEGEGANINPHNFRGGWYKPSKSNIGGAPSNQDYFPLLIVFVQFKNEPGDSTTTNFESWPARKAPNYFDSVISINRLSQTNWWNAYNGYAISDFWHEFSRGKLHVYGNKLSIILPFEISYYESQGIGLVNKHIYETIKPLIINWPDYDRWKYVNDGEFVWEKDGLIDMMYIVYRTRRNFLFENVGYLGVATLGNCEGTINERYTIDSNSTSVTKIYSSGFPIALGSGVRVSADSSSPYSRQKFLDIATHEHGHYLFEFNHKPYAKMDGRGVNHDFSLSPWEVVKLGYINQTIVDYSTPTNYLYDYSSRGLNGVDTNEVLQVPISDSTEFFLIANRRKESQWDRRMGGDTLALDSWQFLKNVNPEYGKGVYIYHVKSGYEYSGSATSNNGDIDLECADGLWSWENAGFNRPVLTSEGTLPVVRKTYTVYNNDYPDIGDPGYTSSIDEMSNGIIFTPGSPDNFFSSPPSGRGTHSLYTNENDYWYSLANHGDRWDGWNVGYNEVFSPYSSPNTNKMNNDTTGIFIWYREFDNSNKKATIEIYEAGKGGKTEADILRLTPPSRPMGLRVLSCDSLPTIREYKRIKLRWNHNKEPDMQITLLGYQNYFKKYKIYRSMTEDMNNIPPDAVQYAEQYYDEIATVYMDETALPEYVDADLVSSCNINFCSPPNCWIKYPVRYRVQAVDKYDSASRLSDFAKTEAWNTNTGPGHDNGDNFSIIEESNLPKEYLLKQNFPNPFNPVTNIQYELPFDNFVTIKIYDILGKEIVTLVNEIKTAGRYIVSFNGSNLSSGIYYYKIEAGNFEQVRQMVLIK